MNEKYDIRFWQDNIWAVYQKDEYGSYLFKGTIEEVNAWLDLQEKGFYL